MAVEAHAGRFLFRSRHKKNLLAILSAKVPVPQPQRVPWFHNPIHDLESTWWIALWTFYHLQNGMDSPSLFPRPDQRLEIWTASDSFRDLCGTLPPRILDLSEGWLTFTQEQYQELEKQDMNDSHFSFDYGPVFDGVLACIEAIINALSAPQTLLLAWSIQTHHLGNARELNTTKAVRNHFHS